MDTKLATSSELKPRPIRQWTLDFARFWLLAGLIAGVATVGLTEPPPPGPAQVSGGGVGEIPDLSPQVNLAAAAPIQLGSAGHMIGFSSSDGSGTQTITLVDTRKSWMAVYHVDRSGKIRLVSSRPIDADFSLQLNATSPLPAEIRALGRR